MTAYAHSILIKSKRGIFAIQQNSAEFFDWLKIALGENGIFPLAGAWRWRWRIVFVWPIDDVCVGRKQIQSDVNVTVESDLGHGRMGMPTDTRQP